MWLTLCTPSANFSAVSSGTHDMSSAKSPISSSSLLPLFALTETHLPLQDSDFSQPSLKTFFLFLLVFQAQPGLELMDGCPCDYFIIFALSSLSYCTSSSFEVQAVRICRLLSHLLAVTHCLPDHSLSFAEGLLSILLSFFPPLFLHHSWGQHPYGQAIWRDLWTPWLPYIQSSVPPLQLSLPTFIP